MSTPSDGLCPRFLRRGLIKPDKERMAAGVWSADARWLVMGTVTGEIFYWSSDGLIIQPRRIKVISFTSNQVTAMAWNNYANLLVNGSSNGYISYMDETFRETFVVEEAHGAPIKGLTYSPFDIKLASCSDDSNIHIWSGTRKTPELTLSGHQADVKCIDWHPYRSLIASGSRDAAIKLWDPKAGSCVSNLSSHKKQVNCLQWNQNGNWLATGARDQLVKVFDIRTMKEIEVYRGHNADVTTLGWHPHHEKILLSGAYNGSLIYWVAGHNQTPHTTINSAHKHSIDVLQWHPAGHIVMTASHDGIIKFWSREPPGSKCDKGDEDDQLFLAAGEPPSNPFKYNFGPLEIGSKNNIPPPSQEPPPSMIQQTTIPHNLNISNRESGRGAMSIFSSETLSN
jgi:polyadenylation factor subunit 2